MENKKEHTIEKTMSKPLREALDENGRGKITFHGVGFEVRAYNELECEVILLYAPNQVYHTTSKRVIDAVIKAKDLSPKATMFELTITPVSMDNGRTYSKYEVVPVDQDCVPLKALRDLMSDCEAITVTCTHIEYIVRAENGKDRGYLIMETTHGYSIVTTSKLVCDFFAERDRPSYASPITVIFKKNITKDGKYIYFSAIQS